MWDDPNVDWGSFDLVVIRSTWDYHERRDVFLRWSGRVVAVIILWNPIELFDWKTDKRYLFDLWRREIAIVPTRLIEPAVPDSIELEGDLVVKPSIGAG